MPRPATPARGPRDGGARFRGALVLALAVHAGLLAWSMRGPDGDHANGARHEPAVVIETDVEVEPPVDERSPVTEGASTDPTRSAPPAALAMRETGRVPSKSGVDVRAEPATPEGAVVTVPPGDEGAWTFSPTAPGALGTGSAGAPMSGLNLGAAVSAGLRVTLNEDRAAAEKRALHRRLIPAFSARDIGLGLVPGQAFVTATRAAVPASRAPMVGHAVLEFQTDAAGALVSVRVVDASSDRADWDELAAGLAKDGHVPPVSVPAGASGLAITVDVTSAVKTVSGQAPTDRPLARAWHAVQDPLDAVLDGKNPASRAVAVRIVDVQAF